MPNPAVRSTPTTGLLRCNRERLSMGANLSTNGHEKPTWWNVMTLDKPCDSFRE